MSANNIIIPLSVFNEKENDSFSNIKPYHELIDFCSIRKQISRIFPIYFREYENQEIPRNKNIIPNEEEYNKLKQEINSIENSIIILKERKQKKLEQIEELRKSMRKEGMKKFMNIKKNRNTSYNRERNDKPCFRQENKDCNRTNTVSGETEEGSSNAPVSGLSSGKDDNGNEETGYQSCKINSDFNNSSYSSFSEEKCNEKMFQNRTENKKLILHKDN